MPQFELSWFPSQIFWLVVCFCILYWTISRILLPPVVRVMKEREQKIQSVLRQADELNAQVDLLMQTRHKYLNKAQEKSDEIIQKAHEEITNNHILQEQHFLNVLKSNTAKTEKELNAKRREVCSHLKNITIQFLEIIFKTIYHVHPRKSSIGKAMDAHLKEFSK